MDYADKMSPAGSPITPNPTLLVAQLNALIENPDAFSECKITIQELCPKAASVFDGPDETVRRFMFSALPGALAYVGQEHNIFKVLIEAGDTPTSFEVLAEKSTIKSDILHPILDYMVCQGMIQEVSKQQYKATKHTKDLMSPLCVDIALFGHSFALPAWGSFHCSLGPRADERTPFQIGHHTNMGFYQLLDLHPVEKAAFHRVMEHLAATVPSWLDQIAFDQEFAQTSPSTPDTILFVDIGGGIGHQCTTIAKKYPNLIGRIILEDQPQVLALSVVAERIEKIPYDYLTVQPIQGARIYYLRQILHNNNDETCIRILKSQLPAMSATSVLLIDDKAIPDERVPGAPSILSATEYSLTMFAMFKAVERRESQWLKLLDNAGYKVSAFKHYSEKYDCIIIAEKKE